MAAVAVRPSSVGIHHALIATDLTHQSDIVVEYGLGFARSLGAQAEIAYVLPAEEYALAGPEAMIAGRDAARRDLMDLKSRLRRNASYDDDYEQQVVLLEGPVAECLLQCAHDRSCDLIVLGTHGRGGFGKVFLGSVAERVFRQSAVPVLTIGPNLRRPARWESVREILAPCDLGPKSRPVLRLACEMAREQHSRLTVLYVVEGESEGAKLDPNRVAADIRERLADLVGAMGYGLDVEYRVEFGRVASTVLRVATHLAANLIVVGVRPSTGLFDRFQWPIAYELVREAPCPVLTIREAGSNHGKARD